MRGRKRAKLRKFFARLGVRNTKNWLCSAEQFKANEMVPATGSQTSLASGYISQAGLGDQRIDTGNIEEAESSLRDGVCLNYEVSLYLLIPCNMLWCIRKFCMILEQSHLNI